MNTAESIEGLHSSLEVTETGSTIFFPFKIPICYNLSRVNIILAINSKTVLQVNSFGLGMWWRPAGEPGFPGGLTY